MKKLFFALALGINAILLSGCEVHMGGATYEVPWWFSIIVGMPFLIFFTVLFINDMPKNFWARCSKCYGYFYVKSVLCALPHTRRTIALNL